MVTSGVVLLEIVEAFKALADPIRLRVVVLLTGVPEGVCVCELVDALRLPQYQVSRHLSVLRTAGLVEGRRAGTWVLYRLRPKLPEAIARVIRAVADEDSDESAAEDRRRLQLRLRLRKNGVCVVGYDPVRPFRDVIPIRTLPAAKR